MSSILNYNEDDESSYSYYYSDSQTESSSDSLFSDTEDEKKTESKPKEDKKDKKKEEKQKQNDDDDDGYGGIRFQTKGNAFQAFKQESDSGSEYSDSEKFLNFFMGNRASPNISQNEKETKDEKRKSKEEKSKKKDKSSSEDKSKSKPAEPADKAEIAAKDKKQEEPVEKPPVPPLAPPIEAILPEPQPQKQIPKSIDKNTPEINSMQPPGTSPQAANQAINSLIQIPKTIAQMESQGSILAPSPSPLVAESPLIAEPPESEQYKKSDENDLGDYRLPPPVEQLPEDNLMAKKNDKEESSSEDLFPEGIEQAPNIVMNESFMESPTQQADANFDETVHLFSDMSDSDDDEINNYNVTQPAPLAKEPLKSPLGAQTEYVPPVNWRASVPQALNPQPLSNPQVLPVPRVTNWLEFQLPDIPSFDATPYDNLLQTSYTLDKLLAYAKQ